MRNKRPIKRNTVASRVPSRNTSTTTSSVKEASYGAYLKWEDKVDRWYEIGNILGLFDNKILTDIVVDSLEEIENLHLKNDIVETAVSIPSVGFIQFINETTTPVDKPEEPPIVDPDEPEIPDVPEEPTISRYVLINNSTLIHNIFVELFNGENDVEPTIDRYVGIKNTTLMHNVYVELKNSDQIVEGVIEEISYLRKASRVHNVYTKLKNK